MSKARIPALLRKDIASSNQRRFITSIHHSTRTAIRSHSRQHSSAASSTKSASWQGRLGFALGLAIGTGYLISQSPILLEAQKPERKLKGSDIKEDEVEGTKQPNGQKLIDMKEVAKHNTKEDCWVVIQGSVYDVTDFLENHPGGAGAILQQAGKDATEIFTPLHPPNTLADNLPEEAYLGPVDPTTVSHAPRELTTDEIRVKEARDNMPSIDSILNLQDIEDLAEKVLSEQGWAYYRSASDGEDSYRNNEESWKRYYFRPRVLRDASIKDPSSAMLGMHVSLPIYISPAAMAKLGHPLGEVNLTRGAGECGIIQGISANASCSLEEMAEARVQGQKLIFQIYLNKDRAASERLLEKVNDLGCNGIMFTVDAAAHSKRTLDQRVKGATNITAPPSNVEKKKEGEKKGPVGVAQAISGYQDDKLVWDDVAFIRKNSKLPILIKGIQCVEDAELAAEHGVEGIILSNHGARQLNFAPASIDVLYEIRQRRPDLFEKLEIYVDGGVKSGTDVVKALALGAKGVGLGRSFLYANACYGEEGVKKVYEILYSEVCAAMAMVGAHKVTDLKPEMVERAWWLRGGQ